MSSPPRELSKPFRVLGKFQVSQFQDHLEELSVKLSILSHDGTFIAVLDKSGQVFVINVASETKFTQKVDDQVHVTSFCWLDNGAHKSTLLTQSREGHLRLYDVIRDVTQDVSDVTRCLCQCHVNTLTSLLSDAGLDREPSPSMPTLLPGPCPLAVVRVGSAVAVLDLCESRPPEVRTVVRPEGRVLSVSGNTVFAVNADNNAEIWDLGTGAKLASIQLSGFLDTAPLNAILSDNLTYAVFLAPENKLTALNLDRYFQNNPSLISEKSNDNLDSDTSFSEAPPSKVRAGLLKSGQKWGQKLSRLASRPSPSPAWFTTTCLQSNPSTFTPHTSKLCKKSKKMVSGFSQSQRVGKAFSSLPDVAAVIDLGLEENAVVDFRKASTSGNKLFLRSTHSDSQSYHVVELDTGQQSTISLPGDGVVVVSPSPTFPSLLLTPRELLVLAPDSDREQLINRLMLYDSAGVADTLCRHNGWDRCTIPVHALEIGLRHRQLDTVAFFLKSRENVFVSHDTGPIVPRTPTLGSSSPQDLPKVGDLDLAQVEPAIDLLIATIDKNVNDNQSKQFAEQLLHLTLDYLHKVTVTINEQLAKVKAAGRSEVAFETEVKVGLEKVMVYIGRLRQYIPGSRWKSQRQEARSHPLDVTDGAISGGTGNIEHRLTKAQQKLIQNWKKISEQEAITDGILCGELSLLQLHLRRRHGGREASLSQVVDFGLKKALDYLQQKQLLLAAQIFSNLGFDVWTKLRQVCLYTADRRLRDYLIEELTSDGHLSPHEVAMVGFVRHLEGLYSCPSYDLAKVLRTDGPQRDWTSKADLSTLMPPNNSDSVTESTGEIAPSDVVNSETASYSHLLLEWTRGWDDARQQAIQLEQLITRRDPRLTEAFSSTIVWRYLLARRDMTRIKRWLDVAYPDPEETAERAVEWPYTLRLDPDLLAEVKDCDPYMRHQILDYLAQRGVISPCEAEDFPLLLRRLSRSCSVIRDPHLLDRCIASPGGLRLNDFHRHMVQLCVTHRLPELLYYYLDYWGLCLGATDLTEVGLDVSAMDPWVAMLLHMRAIAEDTADASGVYEASLAASRFMRPVPVPRVRVCDLLNEGLVGRALTTLVYRPQELQQLMSLPAGESLSQWQAALAMFPRLQTALCRPLVDGVGEQHVTPYHLLQTNAPFDVTHLFGWQIANTLFCGDLFTKMPHFACSDLAAQFGRQLSLHFSYYLRQARPSFAFCSLIISVLQAGHKTLSSRRLKAVSVQAQTLAVKHFSTSPVAAACVAFLEMLGEDTSVLRVRLHAARLVRAHHTAEVTGSAEQRQRAEGQIEKSIGWILLGCMKRRRRCQLEFLTLLEDAIRWQIERSSLKSSSPETLSLWQVAVMFCRVHDIPPTTGYLRDCAKENDWLMFLTFAQLHDFDKDLVHAELGHFTKRALREHLHYVVENVTSLSDVTDGLGRRDVTSDVSPPPRDVRAQLYSRIGVTLARVGDSTSESAPSEEEFETPELKEEFPEPSDFSLPVDPNEDDVFGLLLACDEARCPWRCLSTYAVRYRNPVLAVLAACYPDQKMLSCLCSWLLASSTDSAHQDMIDKLYHARQAKTDRDDHAHQTMIDRHDHAHQAMIDRDEPTRRTKIGHAHQPMSDRHDPAHQAVSDRRDPAHHVMIDSRDPAPQTMSDRRDPAHLSTWDVEDVHTLVLTMTEHGLFKTVLNGLLIFCPDTMLVAFIRFCVAFGHHDDTEVCRQHLETFKTQHSATLRTSHPEPSEDPVDKTFSTEWTEAVVRNVLVQFLSTVTSAYDLGRLFRLLDQTNVTRLFSCEVPDFSKLYRLYQMISPTGLTLNYHHLTLTSDPRYSATCQQALATLEEKRMFNEARVFAEVAGVSSETITLRQMESELSQLSRSAVWHHTSARCAFWRKCHEAFTRHQLSQEVASRFFQGKIPECISHTERGLVCQLSYDWLEVDDQPANQKLKKDLFVQIWMCKIHDHMEKEQAANPEDRDWLVGGRVESSPTVHRSELLQYGHIPSEVDKARVHLSEKESCALEALIGELLDRGKVKDACQVAALVGHYSQDLSIVIACLKLALGHMTVDELPITMRRLVAAPAPRLARRISTASFSSFPLVPSASFASLAGLEEGDGEDDSVLGLLNMLVAHVSKGKFCCQRIVTIFQISQVLAVTFEWTVLQDEFVILQALLNSDHTQRFVLAKAFLASSGLATSQVVGFLSDTILKILNAHDGLIEAGAVTGSNSDSGVTPTVTTMITSLIQLADDSAMLGQRLHDNITSLTSSNHDMAPHLLSVCVELLVASHHCYTLACSMEGIAAVLRSARKLTELLAQAEEYNLLIRLLTGVGRFSEMTYIFDILKQQHQLELLFRKGIDKEEALRMAILDYIQRCHPSDTDTYKMVSLYFTMYREIAAMLEDNANRQIQQLKAKSLESNSEAPAVLQSAIHYYSDAAESYVKEDCVRHAQRCVRQARLAALQLHLLTTPHRVINLNKEEVGGFVSNHPKFWEAYIVAEAYEAHSHWASAICKRYVLQNESKYLTDLRRHVTLTASLITDVTEKYKAETQRPKWAVGQLKKLLTLCPDVKVTYRAAQDLGLTDYSRELLKGDNSAYLRDTVGLQY